LLQNHEEAMTDIKKYIIPKYDELTLFIHGLPFIMLFLRGADFGVFIRDIAIPIPLKAFLIVYLFTGAGTSVYFAFVTIEKSHSEKVLLLFFAIFSNLFAALSVLLPLHSSIINGIGLAQIPLIFNIVYTCILLILLLSGNIADSSISDDNASVTQVIVTAIPLIATYAYCVNVLNAHWSTTYSWCVFVGLITKDMMRFVTTEILMVRGKTWLHNTNGKQ
jgi:hypothetical protein